VCDGHHRVATAYIKGLKTVQALIREPEVTTPLQDLLLDVLWLKGRRELYQPIESPEVADWPLVRRCTDRAAKILEFLHAENVMPPAAGSYLDVACSYGWFVREMSRCGFEAEGVESDPIAISVGELMYGLRAEQMRRSDAIAFLKANQKKFDVVSCFSLAHHYLLNRRSATAEDLLHLLDAATGSVLFFDMGEEHERDFWEDRLQGWNPDRIQKWLETNTTFKRVRRLGIDEDAVPPFQHCYGRTLFACMR
jgi:SAM-dependent methyltransferase